MKAQVNCLIKIHDLLPQERLFFTYNLKLTTYSGALGAVLFCPKSVIFEQTSSFGVGDVPTGIFLQGTPCLVILYIRFVCDGPAILRKTQTGTELLA